MASRHFHWKLTACAVACSSGFWGLESGMYVCRNHVGQLTTVTHCYAQPDDMLTVRVAVTDFAHLIERSEKLGFIEFAHRISKNYSDKEPRIAAVIKALKDAAYKVQSYELGQRCQHKHPYVIVSDPGTDRQSEYDDFPILSKAIEECNRLNKKYRGGYDVMRRLSDDSLTTEL